MVMVGEYTSLAFLLPAATFVGYAIGYLLDHESELSRSRAKIDQGILHHPSALERN